MKICETYLNIILDESHENVLDKLIFQHSTYWVGAARFFGNKKASILFAKLFMKSGKKKRNSTF